jgi:hypothetical protein
MLFIFVLVITLLGVAWVLLNAGRSARGNVVVSLAVSQLTEHARCLWYHVAQNTEQFSKGAWPSNNLRSSCDYFRYILKHGYIKEECITCIIECQSVGLTKFTRSRTKRNTGIKSPNEDINHDNVNWAVVIGCDGKLFSDNNRPTDNLPFLVSRNVIGEFWIPASGVKLMKKDKWQSHVVIITFGGQVVHFIGEIPRNYSMSGLENVTNRLILSRP